MLRFLKGSPGLTIKASLKDSLTSPRLPLSAQAGNWLQRFGSHIHQRIENVGLRKRMRARVRARATAKPNNGAVNEQGGRAPGNKLVFGACACIF